MSQASDQNGAKDDGKPTLLDIHFGKRLHLRRTMLDVDRRSLANMLSMNPAEIGALEDGKRSFDATMVFRLSKALEVPVYWFYDGLGKIDEILLTSSKGATAIDSAAGIADHITRTQRGQMLVAYFETLDDERQSAVLDLARLLATKTTTPAIKRAMSS